MVIIGLLASYVGPRYFAQLGKSEQGVAKAQIEALAKALDAYRLDVGNYPSNDVGLEALINKGNASDKWRGPYLQKAIPLDPWGRPYVYRYPSTTADYTGKDCLGCTIWRHSSLSACYGSRHGANLVRNRPQSIL